MRIPVYVFNFEEKEEPNRGGIPGTAVLSTRESHSCSIHIILSFQRPELLPCFQQSFSQDYPNAIQFNALQKHF